MNLLSTCTSVANLPRLVNFRVQPGLPKVHEKMPEDNWDRIFTMWVVFPTFDQQCQSAKELLYVARKYNSEEIQRPGMNEQSV